MHVNLLNFNNNNIYIYVTPNRFLYKMRGARVCFKASKCRGYVGRLVAALQVLDFVEEIFLGSFEHDFCRILTL